MKTPLAVLALALFSSNAAFGSTVLLTSDPGTGTTTTFTDTGSTTYGSGPVTLDGFSVTGNPEVFAGEGYGFGTNGTWTQSMIATNYPAGGIIFNLGGDYSFVGGLMNYGPGSGSDATITALASDGTTVIGTYDLVTLAPIVTPSAINGEAFRGIESSTANIAYLELGGDYIGAHSLEVGNVSAATPEPSSLLLLGTGLLGAGLLARRQFVPRVRSARATISS